MTAALAATLVIGFAAPIAAGPAHAQPAATPPPRSASYRHGAVPTVGATQSQAASRNSAPINRDLMYGGGNSGVGVTTGPPKVYLVFWGSQWGSQSTDPRGNMALSGDTVGMAPYLQAFMKGLGTGGETWSGIVTQYCQEVPTGAQSCPPSAAAHTGYPTGGALAGVWQDSTTAAPASATAGQLAAEAINAANHFGNTTQAANRDTQYFIVSPAGTTPDGFNTPSGGFCAWHDWTGDPALTGSAVVSSPFAVAFTNMPYVTDAQQSCGMGNVNGGAAGILDGVTIVGGHEYAETVTDQFPPGGWLDGAGNEVGDRCAWIGVAPSFVRTQNITLTTGTFPVQSIWSNDANNGLGDCVISHPVVSNISTPPAIVSDTGYIFTVGAAATFRIMTTGFPVPSISESGSLPAGLAFTDNHDGTALLVGAAAITAGGDYPLTVTAANGVGVTATQHFTLTVNRTRGGTIVNFAGARGDPRGATGDGGPATSATLLTPTRAAADSAGNVYIADTNNSHIRKVDNAGNITNFAGSPFGKGNTGDGGPATAATLAAPEGVAVDPAGNVYLTDTLNNRVRKINAAGIITNFAGNSTGAPGNGGDGGPATSASLSTPEGVAVDGAGNVYIADTYNRRVRKVDTAGVITNFAGSASGEPGNGGDGGPATSATLNGPSGLAVDSAGTVLIADGNIRQVNVAGIITGFAGSQPVPPGGPVYGPQGDGGPAASATVNNAQDVAIDRAGNVYIADTGDRRIRKVDTTGVIANFAGDPGGVSGIWGDGADGVGATSTQLEAPVGVMVDPAGNVYIADTNRVREVLAEAPSITSAAAATFTVGVPGSLTIAVGGFPTPRLAETGSLPSGVTFNKATATLSGTPAQNTAGSYPITFQAVNGIGAAATQNFVLTVNQAVLTYPADGQAGVDTTRPFTWSGIPQAQSYILAVGTTAYGSDLVNSGILAPTQSSLNVPALPAGPTLHATLLAKVNGAWTSYQAISFTAAPGQATFTFPVNGQAGLDPTKAFTWTTAPNAQGYILVVGTTLYGSNLVNTGVLPPTQSAYITPSLPAGQTLYATLLTKVNGAFTRFQAIVFTAGPARANFTQPVQCQLNVVTPSTFTWSTVAGAQNYYLVVGTTLYGTDLVNSGLLPAGQSAYGVPALPHGKILYATILTNVNGNWIFQAISFSS